MRLGGVSHRFAFLLVPEATTVDSKTIETLKKATEKDLYLSNVSPLGIPFNSLRGSSNEIIKNEKIAKGKPGSPCPKKFLVSNTEYSEKAICTASKKYQTLKLNELKLENLNSSEYTKKAGLITDKTCLCEGLSNTAIINYKMKHKGEDQGVAICPGPNLAYFSEELSLKDMVNHIYGKSNVIATNNRPHMFIKELMLHVDCLKKEAEYSLLGLASRTQEKLREVKANLYQGIEYYQKLAKKLIKEQQENFIQQLESLKHEVSVISIA